MIYGFYDLWGFHSSVSVHEFLVVLPFRGILCDDKFWGKPVLFCGFMLLIVLAILLYGWAVYGFCDLVEFHSSTTVHGFPESWWFRGFFKG